MGLKKQKTKKTCKQKQKQSHRDMYATRHTRNNCWTSSKMSHLVEPVTPFLVTTEQARAMTIKNTIPFW
jgi:hypothetical protein